MKPTRDSDIEVYFSKWEFTARYNVGGSDLESLTLTELLDLAAPDDRRAWDELYLGYTETYGDPELRKVIAGTYERMTAENILCFCGAEEGIFAAMHAALTPDDHALILVPNYQSAETLPLGICRTEAVCLDPDDDWALDPDRVKAAFRPNTKMLYINFPHNPTGKILEPDRFEAIVELCRERGIWLFSDEVYRGIERDPARRLPQAADRYERALSLNVMSKAYGLAGLRLGWIACQDKSILEKMERIKHFLSICNPAPSELLTRIALKARESILDRNRAIVDENLKHLDAFFAKFPDRFEWKIPDGGSIGYPRYLGSQGVAAFADRMVREAGVVLVPAAIFRSELTQAPTDRFRIGYGRKFLPQALAAMEALMTKGTLSP